MLNESTQHAHYVPVASWMVYHLQPESQQEDLPQLYGAPEYYLEEHTLHRNSEGSYQLGSASPLVAEKIKAICQVVQEETTIQRQWRGMLPRNLLSFETNPERLIWQVPAAQRTLHFQLEGLSSGTFWCPSLILEVTANQALRVYAVKSGNVRESTRLYRAPFPNIQHGRVCLGSAQRWIKEPTTYAALMKQWESIFFDSTFNSDSAHQRAKQPLAELWGPLLNRDVRFPTKALLKTPLTLNDLLP